MSEKLDDSEKTPAEERLDSLEHSGDHLKEGIKPIMTCVFDATNGKEGEHFPDTSDALYVNYDGSVEDKAKKKITTNTEATYVISPIDVQNKWSDNFQSCTGVIAVGKSKEDGQEISFISHQSPSNLGDHADGEFIEDIKSKFRELKNLSEEGTIDVKIFGGRYSPGSDQVRNHYINSIKTLEKIISGRLGFVPTVITGPNLFIGKHQKAYFETQNRRLYISKPELPYDDKKTNFPYMASNIDEEEKVWEKHFDEK